MGGPIGATSGKFILIGAALVLHGRVNDNNVRVAIMPGASTSAISPALADRLKAHGGGGDVRIHLRAESFRANVTAVEPTPAPDGELRVGQDVFDENPIEIDFAHHDLQPLSSSEARQLERKSHPIIVRHEADGTLSVEIAEEG